MNVREDTKAIADAVQRAVGANDTVRQGQVIVHRLKDLSKPIWSVYRASFERTYDTSISDSPSGDIARIVTTWIIEGYVNWKEDPEFQLAWQDKVDMLKQELSSDLKLLERFSKLGDSDTAGLQATAIAAIQVGNGLAQGAQLILPTTTFERIING